jgi:glutaredoxin
MQLNPNTVKTLHEIKCVYPERTSILDKNRIPKYSEIDVDRKQRYTIKKIHGAKYGE